MKKQFSKIIWVICLICTSAVFFIACGEGSLTYTGRTLFDGAVGIAYTGSVAYAEAEDNDDLSITYKLKIGSNTPKGLIVNSDGSLTGTPTEAAEEHTFTVVASADGYKDAEAEFTITVAPALSYTGSTLAEGKVNASYIQSVATATAAGASGIKYEIDSGRLPTGLSLSDNGVISGVPTEAVTALAFTVAASASGFTGAKASFTITIAESDTNTVTFIMESEDVSFVGKSGPGISGSQTGDAMIQRDEIGTKLASNGRFVAYCHSDGIFFTYEFESDTAATGSLYLRLSSDIGGVPGFGSDALEVNMNGTAIEFGPHQLVDGVFYDFLITEELQILEGDNTIILTVLPNDLHLAAGYQGTMSAFGPMFDCVKIIADENVTLSWTPVPYNY